MKSALLELVRAEPDYAEVLARSRPVTLLAGHPLSGPGLKYRYDDNGETVTVPNIWRNQTVAMQISTLRRLSIQMEASARALLKVPMLHRSATENSDRARDFRIRARLYHLMATRLVLLGEKAVFSSFYEMEQAVVKTA